MEGEAPAIKKGAPYISPHLPMSPHISPHLPISPHISPYLPISLPKVAAETYMGAMAAALKKEQDDQKQAISPYLPLDLP